MRTCKECACPIFEYWKETEDGDICACCDIGAHDTDQIRQEAYTIGYEDGQNARASEPANSGLL